MFRKLVMLLTILTLSGLYAGSGIASDSSALHAQKGKAPAPREKVLALFIDALLEKNPERQSLKLLDVAAQDLNNADTPLQAFKSAFIKLKKRSGVLKKFNTLWAKHPDNLLLALHGAPLNNICGTPAKERLRQLAPLLEMPPSKLTVRPGWKNEYLFTFLTFAAEAMLQDREFGKLSRLFDHWYKTPIPCRTVVCLALAEYCFTGSARAAVAANSESAGKALSDRFRKALSAIAAGEKNITDRRTAAAVILFYSNFRPVLPGKAVGFAREYDRRVRSTESNLWLLSAAVEQGSLSDFNKAAALVTEINPRFDSTELRFKTFLNAGMFAAAEKTIKRLPEKHHFDLMCQLHTMKKDWNALYNYLISNIKAGTPPDLRIGHTLLAVSEKLLDPVKFRMAEKILAPHLKHPGIANAVGYVSAVLNIDLPRARKLLEFALQKEPRNAAYLDSMAWIAFKQKRYAEAEKWISKALTDLNPREGIATILEHAGDIAAAQGKSPVNYYKLSLKYAPFEREFETAPLLRKIKALK